MTAFPEGVASEEDVERLERLLRASFGQFRTMVVRAPEVRHAALVQWLQERIPVLASWVGQEGRVQVLDISQLRGVNLLQEMKEHLASIQPGALHPSTVLILFGFEAAERRTSRRSGPLQQLNVQRDVLVRAFPCPWIVLMDPALDRVMGNIAPDFADFVALRIGGVEILLDFGFSSLDVSHSEVQLERLLPDLFSTEELRRLVTGFDPTLSDSLPGANVTLAQLARETVRLMERAGRTDAFIAYLDGARPQSEPATRRFKHTRRVEASSRTNRPPLVTEIAELSPAAWEELLLRLDVARGDIGPAPGQGAEALVARMSTRPDGMAALLRVLQDIQKDRY